VTFKDLQKLLQSQSGPEQLQLLHRLRDKSFWIWDQSKHKQEDIKIKGDSCFNHIIGLPRKDGIEKSIFDYEKLLYDSLLIPDFYNDSKHNFKHKHLWVKKATGLGVTEFMLRLMAWLCLRNYDYRNSQMCIVTGPNQGIAIKLIKRMKGLFEHKLGITFANKETVLELNGCSIEAYPSNHLDAYRALDNPKFILLDKADFFRKSEQEDVRHVSERYIAKSDPLIVVVSTPYAPDGLFDSIEKEPEESCIYKRILLDYTYGLDKIYTREEIEKAKISPSFEREYNLKYLGGIGNVFHTKDIDLAIEKGKLYDPSISNTFAKKCMGIDPAYGSSSFGIVITQFVNGYIQILHAEEYKRPDFNEMLSQVWDLLVKYSVQKIYIDGANPSFIKSLKMQWGERFDYENVKKENRQYMKVEPINFNQEHKEMLGHCKMLLERRYFAINPAFDKLITSLRTAVAEENILDKESSSYADIFDAYRLALKHYKFITKEVQGKDVQTVKTRPKPNQNA
jgi:terminase large subunit-like protein